MTNDEFKKSLHEKTQIAENIILEFLPEEAGLQKTVIKAANYSVLAGGKRLRPMMMKETFDLFGGSGDIIKPFMAAMEMIHTYSLVHDDLPAMDNDEYRRGQRTTWAVFGDAFGVLAGDALLNYAFETALKAYDYCESEADFRRVTHAMRVLFKKSGIYGMIGGQTLDVEAEKMNRSLTMDELLFIHENKTAALIQAALCVGAILAGADKATVDGMERCGYDVGVAFQIRDDILDVTGDSAEMGKSTGSDAANNKQTYVTINGLERSAQDVEKLTNEAVEIIKSFGKEDSFLKELLLYLIDRRK